METLKAKKKNGQMDFLLYVTVLLLCAMFVLLNVALTGLTLAFGAALYGYGFALATLLTLAAGLLLLSRRLHRLEYQTFMLQ